jgi:UrcA family protein
MNSIVKTHNRTMLAYVAAMWLACGLVASNAYADDQARSETVKFADLNVNTQAGAAALYGRIHAAAGRVCDKPGGWMPSVNACVTKAESEAIGKVSLPLLTAYYEQKTGKHPPTFTANR